MSDEPHTHLLPFPVATFTARESTSLVCRECRRVIVKGEIAYHLSDDSYVHAAECS